MRQSVKWAGFAALIVIDILDFNLAWGHPSIFAYAAPVLIIVTVVYGLFAAITSTKSYKKIAAGDFEPYPLVPQNETQPTPSEPTVVLIPSKEAKSRAAELATALKVDRERIIVPQGATFQAVHLRVFGTVVRTGYYGWVKVEETESHLPSTDSIYWPDNPWAGLVPRNGVGWFLADGFRFTDDRFRDVLVIPITPSDVKRSMEIRGTWKDGSLKSMLTIDRIYLDWSLTPSGKERHPHLLWVEGKYGPGRFDSDRTMIASEKGDRDFRIQVQPSNPVAVVAHKKQLTPLALVNGLTQAGILRSLIIGGRGLGSFKGTIMQAGGGLMALHFDSEPFTF